MRRFRACFGLLLMSAQALFAADYREVPELAAIFQKEGLDGTFVLLDISKDTIFLSNKARAERRITPASTFKIANSLIGLDCGAVRDVDEALPYGGKPQRIKAWEHDMGLRDAIKISNVPVYQELAQRIGLERMRAGIKKLGYGNMEIGTVVDRFWLAGPLAISPVEQTDFLRRLAEGKLPVKEEAIRAVKEITLVEKTDSYELHAKTGWLVKDKEQVGWWVGWIEREGNVYPFALNFDMTKDADAEKRIPIGRECLKALGKL
jgi:beta-lactamase class D